VKKDSKAKKINDKIICSSCGKEKEHKEYYVSNSPFHVHTNRLHVCKECIWNFIGDDVSKLKLSLRMLDKPFLVDLLKSSQDEAEKTNKNPIKIYMKNVGMPQYKNHTWDDSSFDDFKSSKKITSQKKILEEIEEDIDLSIDEVKYLKSFWGKGFELEDLIWLQTEYEDWTNRYECDSKGMETLIQEICLQQLDIKTRRANGEKVDQQLKTLQDLLGSSNLKPVQETGANAVEQESFGTLIKKFENERPIPEPDERWKDVDGISKYLKVWFLGHLARMVGLENPYQKEYDEEVNKYKIELDENEEDDDNDILQ
jgi:hypothetical protein